MGAVFWFTEHASWAHVQVGGVFQGPRLRRAPPPLAHDLRSPTGRDQSHGPGHRGGGWDAWAAGAPRENRKRILMDSCLAIYKNGVQGTVSARSVLAEGVGPAKNLRSSRGPRWPQCEYGLQKICHKSLIFCPQLLCISPGTRRFR